MSVITRRIFRLYSTRRPRRAFVDARVTRRGDAAFAKFLWTLVLVCCTVHRSSSYMPTYTERTAWPRRSTVRICYNTPLSSSTPPPPPLLLQRRSANWCCEATLASLLPLLNSAARTSRQIQLLNRDWNSHARLHSVRSIIHTGIVYRYSPFQ